MERRGSTAGGQWGGEAGESAPRGLWTWAGVENEYLILPKWGGSEHRGMSSILSWRCSVYSCQARLSRLRKEA